MCALNHGGMCFSTAVVGGRDSSSMCQQVPHCCYLIFLRRLSVQRCVQRRLMFITNCLQVLQQRDRAAVLWTSVLTRQAHLQRGLARALQDWFSASTKGTLHNVSTMISWQRGSCVARSRLVSGHLSVLKFFTIPKFISARAMLKSIIKYKS